MYLKSATVSFSNMTLAERWWAGRAEVMAGCLDVASARNDADTMVDFPAGSKGE